MKKIGLAVTLLIVVLLITLPLLSCAKSSSKSSTTPQTTTVKRGSITINVTGTGNLALSHTEDMAFPMDGTVDQVMVSAGDQVKKGDKLASLDTSAWDTQLKTLQRALITSQRSLTSATNAVGAAQRDITTKSLVLRSAQNSLQTAQNNLDQIPVVQVAQDAVDNAKFLLQYIKLANAGTFGVTPPTTPPLNDLFIETSAKKSLTDAQQNLADILKGIGQQVTADVALQISQMQLGVDQAQASLTTAQANLDISTAAVNDVQLSQQLAQQDMKDAQTNLDEAQAESPIIVAPFDGFITKVNVAGGDAIKKGTIAVTVADPTRFEANVLVSEMDIYSITSGGNATVQATALSGLTFPAKVSAISPTATIQSGVVNYAVTVDVQPTPIFPGSLTGNSSNLTGSQGNQTRQGFSGSSSNLTGTSGNQTRPGGGQTGSSNQTRPSSGNQTGSSTTGAGQSTLPVIRTVQLKQGLSVTVNIMVTQKNDILLVPNRAITRQGRNTVVQVSKNGVTSTQVVQTGLSDLTNTEITSGLNEGDVVVLPQATTSTTTTQRGGGSIFVGPGGFGR